MSGAAASSHKHFRNECSCVLTEPGILEQVLSFLACEGVYVKTVCKEWSASYKKLMAVPQKKLTLESQHAHSCSCTAVSAAFTSAARVRLAGQWGLHYEKPDYRLSHSAGSVGDTEALLAAHELGLPYSKYLASGVAESGCLEKLKWLCMEQGCQMPDDITEWAAASGSIEMLRWLKETGFTFTQSTSWRAAARANNLHVLQYLLDEGCPWYPSLCVDAAGAGDLQQLQWLYEHGGVLDSTTAECAAEGGSIKALEWLQQQRVVFASGSMLKAAESDNLQLCKWLHAAQCPLDESVYFYAAGNCNLELLNWLFDVGCPYNLVDFFDFMSGMKDCYLMPVLHCLQQHGVFDSVAALTLALNHAGAHNNSLAAAQWLRQQGAEWPAELYSEQECNEGPWCGDTLEWARAEGCTAPVPEDDD
jgi:hypothetical protein